MTPPESKVDLTICIVNWNDPKRLSACLQSLRDIRSLNELSWEVLVVDNGSSDHSVTMVRSDFPEAEVFALPENISLSAAYNTAIRHGKGRYFLILNNDIILTGTCVQTMADFLSAKKSVGAVVARLTNMDGTFQSRYYPFVLPSPTSLLRELLWLPRVLGRLSKRLRNAPLWDPKKPCPMEQVPGACLMVRREVFESVGLWDDGFRFSYEDVDFCARCRQAGWELWYLPEAIVFHVGGAAAFAMPIRETSLYRFHGMMRYSEKHFTRLQRAMLDITLVAVLLLRLPLVALCECHPREAFRRRWQGTHRVYLRIIFELMGM